MDGKKTKPVNGEAASRDFRRVARILQGETGLFAELMRDHNQRLYRLARSIVKNDAEAEDVLQEAYLLAFRRLHQYRGEGEFAAWLSRIVVYQAMHARRERLRWRPLDETQPEEPTDEVEHDMTLQQAIIQGIEDLPPSLRPVFVLREVEGLDVRQTAASLGISEANVKVRLHRAKQALQASLGRMLGPELKQVYGFDGERCNRMVERVMMRIQAGAGDGLFPDR